MKKYCVSAILLFLLCNLLIANGVRENGVYINEIGEPYEMDNTWASSYIELINYSETTVDISGWSVWSYDNDDRSTSSFVFPDDTFIGPNEFIIATRDRAAFLLDYGDYVDENIVSEPESTTGQGVYIGTDYNYELKNSSNETVDVTTLEINWNSQVHEKTEPDADGQDSGSWYLTYQTDPVQGTPGQPNSEPPVATPYTIYEIQYTEDAEGDSPHNGERVETGGIVTAIFDDFFFLQDGAGEWNGICTESTIEVSLGDSLLIEASVSENYSRTTLNNLTLLNQSSGFQLPEKTAITTSELNTEERWEGVLVSLNSVTVTNDSLGFGEWEVDDGSGPAVVDDYASYGYQPNQNDVITELSGVVEYSYGNYKLEPRSDDDITFGEPLLSINPNEINFGEIDYNTQYEVQATLNNIGAETLTINQVVLPEDYFDINPRSRDLDLPLSIEPNGEYSINITCQLEETRNKRNSRYYGEIEFHGNFDTYYLPVTYQINEPQPAIVINEIMYNPSMDIGYDDDFEYLELYNNDENSVDISNWYFSEGFDYTFPANTEIAPNAYIVIAIDPDSLLDFYDISSDIVYGPFSGNLTNSGEDIVLTSTSGASVDSVEYAPGGDWPSEADGSGVSLELIDPSSDNTVPDNWEASFQLYGTPGEENSEETEATPYTIYEIQYTEAEDGNSPHTGERIITTGVVTAIFDNIFTIQDGNGQWNGIIVEATEDIAIGDSLSLQATVNEVYGRTTLQSVTNLITFDNVELPDPTPISTNQLNNEEKWEGVLVSVNNVTITNPDLDYGEWEIDDGSGPCVVDDMGDYTYTPQLNDYFETIKGIVEYSFENFKLEPRDDTDFIEGSGPILHINPEELNFGAVQLEETEILPLEFSNTGTSDVSINEITATTEFFEIYSDESYSELEFPITIEPSHNDTVFVYFTPEEVMVYEDSITVSGNFDDVFVPLSGSGSEGSANIVINEIMYNPASDLGNDEFFEYLELFNNDEIIADLSSWSFSQGIEYIFPDGTIIEPGEYLVIASNPDSIMSFYGIDNVVGPFDEGGLSNNGEAIELIDSNSEIIDQVEYSDGDDWPSSADGSGSSLELTDPNLDNNLPESWQASFVINGTPGDENSEEPTPNPYSIYDIQYTENEDGISPHINERVITSGVITAVFPEENYIFIQDGSGEWNGIKIEHNDPELEIGDEIEFTATVSELYDCTTLTELDSLSILSTENPIEHVDVLTGDVATKESLEGVFIKVNQAYVTNDSLGFGEWEVDDMIDSSGPCVVDDYGDYAYEPQLDDNLDIKGVVEYSFGNYKIEPRFDEDIEENTSVEEDDDEIIETKLYGNFPNPFSPSALTYPSTTIRFTLAKTSKVELIIYNIKGQVVRQFTEKSLEPGRHKIEWNGRNSANVELSSGVYFYRLKTNQNSFIKKAIILK